MLSVLTDENFSGHITQGLLRRLPDLNLLRVQDAGLMGADDSDVLDAAASQDRILLTHDGKTMPNYAYDRIAAGEPMSGLIVASQSLRLGTVIDELAVVVECSNSEEWQGQIVYLPL